MQYEIAWDEGGQYNVIRIPAYKNKARTGAIGEHLARAWLLRDGYDMFPNGEPRGDIDILAIKDGEIFKIDVKTVTLTIGKKGKFAASGDNGLSERQKADGVVALLFSPLMHVSFDRDVLAKLAQERLTKDGHDSPPTKPHTSIFVDMEG